MKILHCSDIHLGKRPFGSKEFSNKRYLDYFDAFDQIITKGIENNVDLFLIAGDLFDKKELTPDILERCEKLLYKLKVKQIPVFIIEGNHDNINKIEVINSWTNYLEKKELLIRGNYHIENGEYIFTKYSLQGINIFGLGYPGFAIDTILDEIEKKLDPTKKNIIVVHTAIGGSDYLPGLASPESIKKLKDKVIYIAGGHLHSYQIYPKADPILYIPGSSEYWNVLNERADEKGCIIFDTESKKHEFIKIKPRKRIRTSFTINNKEELHNDFKKFCEELALTGEELVIVNINTNDSSYINIVELEEILEKSHALKGYIELKYRNNQNINDNDNFEDYSIKDIENNIIQQWNIFKDSKKITNYLQKFKEYQENNTSQDDFFELFDMMLEEEIDNEN